MIPESALVSPQWLLPGKSGVNVWHLLGECFGLHRVARKARVDEGKMRQSCVHMLWSARPDDDHWTTVVENGISFSFDITRVMFCSGNCTERMRAAHFNVADKIVVDLYCGIGYYTLPFLVKGRAGLVHACEMNPDSICALRRNLAAAGVSPERYFIHEGDNQVTTQMLDSVADVVSLGLLPSSEAGWPLAAAVLRAEGGTLHVHENVHEVSLQSGEWLAMCLYRLGTLMADRGKPMRLVCTHLEKVKSYAPRVFHIVADIDCIPLRDSLLTN
jgi:tRNA G37 N-methylase Trm5